MTLVITSCTNRKTRAAPAALRAGDLCRGSIEAVAAQWAERVCAAGDRFPAQALYQGRAFREAEQAARAADARFAILSAGLALVSGDLPVPAYALTVVPGSPDNVLEQIASPASPKAWWRALRGAGLGTGLATLAGDDLVLIAAGRVYLEMLAADGEGLPRSALRRVRVFTGAPPRELPPIFQPLVMPYDERLDGANSPRPGAMSDFAQRALHDFATEILPQGADTEVTAHAEMVRRRLASWQRPVRTRGAYRSDPELRSVIAQHWQAVGGRSTAMLRLLRDELGIACEQGRFRRLFASVSEERAA